MKLALLLWMSSVLPQPLADQTCLATTVYLEARSEPVRGQLAVAEVALRRREQGRWGSDLCHVLRARGQFALSTTNENFKINNWQAWAKSWNVAALAMNVWALPREMRVAVVPGADHFFAAYADTPAWAVGTPMAVIGDHHFYALN
jgi:spore germination cell wall hydrolase CwlJ-like protein